MTKSNIAGTVCLVLAWCLTQERPVVTAQGPVGPLKDPSEIKEAILERLPRLPPTYRGDGGLRLKWEWYDGVIRGYLFEKSAAVEEASASSGALLRADYVLRGVKVTFQEILRLPESDDEKLIPVFSFVDFLSNSKSDVFNGLALLGKDGELKGTVIRKYVASTVDVGGVGAVSLNRFAFIDAVEYKDQKTGKIETARGLSYDAVNFRWRDIKNRVADDMTEERATERRSLLREAYAKSLKASVPER